MSYCVQHHLCFPDTSDILKVMYRCIHPPVTLFMYRKYPRTLLPVSPKDIYHYLLHFFKNKYESLRSVSPVSPIHQTY